MSSDLLAEFDSFYQAPGTTQSNSTPASNDLFSLSNTSQGGNTYQSPASTSQWNTSAMKPDIWGGFGNAQTTQQQTSGSQDDVWGSFETNITPQQSYKAPSLKPSQDAFASIAHNANRPSGVRRSTIDMFNSMNLDSPPRTNYKTNEVPLSKAIPVRQNSSGGDILFDAADELSGNEEDDEFGDFETVTQLEPQAQPPPSQSLNDLFGATTVDSKRLRKPQDLLSTTGALPYPQAPKSPSFKERNPFSDLGLATKQISTLEKVDKPKSASPITAWPSFEPVKPAPYQDSPAVDNIDNIDDEWGEFADLPPETPAGVPANPSSGIKADAWAWDAADKVTETAPPVNIHSVNMTPPSNIPPPSVLLSLFPEFFDLPQSTLFRAVANQPFSLKNRIISDPSTVEFLRAYLLIATVAAHILAGRKLRWKRDTLLSQAMKIGPAAAGGKGGMKLAGVDKAEVTKEDREAADVIRIWREQLGRLRSAVAVANQSMREGSTHLAIPEINEAMHVKVQDSALTAPKTCVICGLKREERVSKVDLQVEDSFGEWWVDHWGHRACRNFWQEHEGSLKHR
jgi:hypothetical protein